MEKFQAIDPCMLLKPYIRQYWFIWADGVAQKSQRVMPAGSIVLTFSCGAKVCLSENGSSLPRSYISGQITTFTDIHFDMLDSISVVFHPIGAKTFFDIPMNEFNGQIVAIDALSDSRIMELEDRLLHAADNKICVGLIEDFLLKRLRREEDYNYKRLFSVLSSVDKGENDLFELAQTACLSYKQFKRIFVEYAGLNPKEFLQITRFSKTLNMLQTKPILNLNELADGCRYYDKSHLIKDFKAFSGYTPTEFRLHSDPYSDYMKLFQSFFINTDVI